MELRRAEPGDEMAVAAVHVRSWQVAYRGIVPDAFLDSMRPEDNAARYTFAASGPRDPVTTIAVARERVVGFVRCGPAQQEADAGLGMVFALYADPDHWSRGVGVVLMGEARSRLESWGFSEAVLWVLEANARARRFYERDGWAFDGTVASFEVGGIAIPEVRMRRRLDAVSR